MLLKLHAVVVLALAFIPAPRGADDLSDVLGVAHVDGRYFLNADQDFLDEGADQVLATGSRTIKLYLVPTRYKWNSDWPRDMHAVVDVVRTPYFRSTLAKPFKTVILTAYALAHVNHNYWTTTLTADDKAAETREFHDLARYLLTTYKGSGKTFVLQHWEGDWSLRDDGDHAHTYDPKYTPTPTALANMVEWLNARQAGITKARDEAKDSDVRVYGAAEANLVEESIDGGPGVANTVLPHTTVDLVSYSCYRSLGSVEQLGRAVDFLAAHLPPTAAFGQNTRSVYLGEFGYPENGTEGVAGLNRRLNVVLDVVKSKQLPWAIFWEIYSNELREDRPPTLGADEAAAAAAKPMNGKDGVDRVKGHWMVKPDGTPGASWHRYRQQIVTSDPSRATATAIKSKLSPLFHDDFARPDGVDIGPGWKQSAHYGPIGGHLADHKLQLDIADGTTIQWTSDTLDLKNPSILGRGLNVGEYFEVAMQRLDHHGHAGVELFDSDQLRQGAGMSDDPTPLHARNSTTWVPLTVDDRGEPIAFDWNRPHTLGVRFDSADGHFATFSYYVDDHYAGSWLVRTANRTLDKVGVFAQSDRSGSRFAFSRLDVFVSGAGKPLP